MLPSEKQMQIDFNKINIVTDCLKVLSNPDRLKILCVLINGEINVHTIEKMTDIHQPTLSQQLTVLRKSSLVATRRDGKQIFYQISDEKILVIMQTLYGLYCQ
ncbi:ArsR/SmtB family transcription factor [Acinetobacter populi]|uniref:Transcriptional regulator n=1 Tax=Acinetobacter populi TaxID=1582270 RepID=A0A1Z9YY18_9GAMM|nr:metalloregulator ArsR/SmtB family transcription factor [Acinetobacter populi]OUY07104.1 transcriptional regulator [Acinetobacter populi]